MWFSKMHGLGNDFMIIDAITQNVNLFPDVIKRLSDRHCGIGFDQLLMVEPSYDPEIDFHYRIFNADGEEVNQCGNGIRCFARFIRMKKLTTKHNICVSTHNKHMILFINNDDQICINMGEPDFEPKKIPFCATGIKKTYIIYIAEQIILCGVVSIGNPHCIITVENLKKTQVTTIGSVLESHHLFPERANIGFMQIINSRHISLRVYERGVGETQSCGSGACAAVAVGIQQGLLDEKVLVDLSGGRLVINWQGIGYPLYMIGSAVHIYDGYINI